MGVLCDYCVGTLLTLRGYSLAARWVRCGCCVRRNCLSIVRVLCECSVGTVRILCECGEGAASVLCDYCTMWVLSSTVSVL
jgi:hypothetical protein